MKTLKTLHIHLKAALIKNGRNKEKVELDLSSDAAKSNLKVATGTDTSKLAKMADSANLKSVVDKLDTDKL